MPITTIKCKYCGREIEITEALRHEVEEEAFLRAKKNFDYELQKLKQEAEEDKKSARKLQQEVLQLTSQIRKIKAEEQELKIKMAKKLVEEEEKIRIEARKAAQEESRLKILEKEKQLLEALAKNEELRRKLEQGSQQTQGEVLELDLEEVLKKEFPNDTIKAVPKGVRGADLIQEVRDKTGRVCGTILWETKNARWNPAWLAKLRSDQRAAKADLAVLLSVNLPSDINLFAYRQRVWVTGRASMIGLATALRLNLYQVFMANLASEGKEEKTQHLYKYLTSNEFRQKVEGLVESFDKLHKEIETERRWFTAKWERQEKAIRQALDNTFGIYGSLQTVIGSALPEIKSLELPKGDLERH